MKINGFTPDSRRRGLQMFLLLALFGLTNSAAQAQQILIKNGEKVAFLGDSITQLGASQPAGYVNLVVGGMKANGIEVEAIPAGVSGHKSNDMLKRLDRDVLSKKPDWMTLSCGVNDVWQGANVVPLEQYQSNITQIVDKAQAANIKVIVFTASMIGEDQPNANNQKLLPYNDFLKALAVERKLPLVDINSAMQAELQATPHQGLLLTTDGVHMNPTGNMMMATGILKKVGLSEPQVAKAREAWLDIPRAVTLVPNVRLTLRQYQRIGALAAKRNLSIAQLLHEEISKALEASSQTE